MSERKALIRAGMKVALVPCPALGDTTLFLWLAWRLQAAGARVVLASGSLFALRDYLPGLDVIGGAKPDVPVLAECHDLVICAIDWYVENAGSGSTPALDNVAYLAGKKLPARYLLDQRPVLLEGRPVTGAHNVICRDPKAGKTMVQWIDLYAAEVLGLDISTTPVGLQSLPDMAKDADRRVAIFPTTPHASKNYSVRGFRRLAAGLAAKGWLVEFVGTLTEQTAMQSQYPEFAVHAFADLKDLVDYLRTCSIVISNDSGGGHLGSLLGLRTFTITRRRPDFTWRPGFNALNQVVRPVFTFKWMGKTIWRPFIPLGRVMREFPVVARP